MARAARPAHRLVVERVVPTHCRVIVVFGCSCADGKPESQRYTGDETTGATEAEARSRAAAHVRTHAAIAGGNPLPALNVLNA